MPQYSVKLTIKTKEPVGLDELADHCREAASCWGGQYHPEDELFSTQVSVRARCGAEVVKDDDFDTFLAQKRARASA